jgi:hypothetical protein
MVTDAEPSKEKDVALVFVVAPDETLANVDVELTVDDDDWLWF